MMLAAIATGFVLLSQAQSKPYADPNGDFALSVPANYQTNRFTLDGGFAMTQIARSSEDEGPQMVVAVQKLERAASESEAATLNDAFAEVVKGIFTEGGKITKQSKTALRYASRPALRQDLEYRDEEGKSWKGWLLAVSGEKNAFVLLAFAPSSDQAGFQRMVSLAETFAPESRQPRNPLGGLSSDSLASLAKRTKEGLQRQRGDSVLVAGEPPLTYRSVANFVTVVELLFDIQLTESEFEATRDRFVEYFTKSDADGRRILALQGESLLASMTSGTDEAIAQSRREGKAVFENAFRRGAEQGIGYAQLMWTAIQRRQAPLTSAKAGAQPKQTGWDTTISEADLDATLEMLYFMWVAAGRDASDVTLDDIAKIRAQIIEALPTMEPELQLAIANAPKVYAGLRQQWTAATAAERVALATRYGQALDSWGIGAQSSFEQSGSSNGSMMADLAQNTAWNAAKTWSTTSN